MCVKGHVMLGNIHKHSLNLNIITIAPTQSLFLRTSYTRTYLKYCIKCYFCGIMTTKMPWWLAFLSCVCICVLEKLQQYWFWSSCIMYHVMIVVVSIMCLMCINFFSVLYIERRKKDKRIKSARYAIVNSHVSVPLSEK